MITDAVEEISRLGSKCLIAVDSRERIHLYEHVLLKPNHIELLKAGIPADPEQAAKDDLVNAPSLSRDNQAQVLVTAGAQGALWTDGVKMLSCRQAGRAPLIRWGGDCLSLPSWLACTGAEVGEAVFTANLAARVVVKKLKITGTATPMEILREHQLLYGEG